jgi:PadR family transcriptional regulator, regulatory protein AphA
MINSGTSGKLRSVINLTPTSYIVLGLVGVSGEATPYELKQMVAATVGNFFGVPHSQIYSEPERLARAGFLKENRETTGRRRKRYSLTARGRKALREWIDTPTDELYELRDPGLLKLGFGTDPKKLAPVQLEAHKRRLAELEAMLAQMKVMSVPENQRLVLEAGIGHEREYVRFWSKLGT